ncbi:MAG: glycosyl hydrolase [Chloroflexota bacterium]
MKRPLTLLAILFAFLAVMVLQAPEVRSATATPIKEMIGVNAVVNNNPSDLAQVVGWIRDYHKWYWYEATKDVYSWSTGWQRLDSFYGTLKAAGVKVMPDVEFAPGWASSNGKTDGVPDAAQHAEYLRELVRHYGDTIAAVENFNEPNQTWQPVRFPANVFGAMTAGDYDAVKAADPRMPLVLAGMAGPDTSYLETAHQASGGKYDVVNFHWYAVGDTVVGGKNPEAGGLLEAIDRVKAWRDARVPGKPIWITEFGWDTFAQPDGRKSKIYAPEANAANYLLRSIFLMQGRGIEKGFAYLYRDVTDNNAYLHNVYSSSGLVANNAEKDGRKKPGWYYLATLKGVLGDYVLDRIVSNGPNIYHYEYVLPGTDKRAAVLWARNGIRDSGYKASYSAAAGTLVVPTAGSTTGAVSQTDGRLTLTERPVFVLYRGEAAPAATALPTQTAVPTSTPVSTPIPTSTPVATPVPTQAVASPAGSGTELLANGGFEGGLANWFIPSWFAQTASADGSQVHGGSRALKFQGNVAGPYSYQEVAASPGQKVDFSGWVKVPQVNGDMSMIVDMVPRHQYNGDLQVIRLASIAGVTGGWVQISGSGVMPDRTVKVRLIVRFPRLNGTVYLDDLSLHVDVGR